MDRSELLENWLREQFGDDVSGLVPASSDASFRRYFRVAQGNRTLIVMDAPPEHEDCRPFVHVARLFRAAGVAVPDVLAADLEQGFLVLTDLGDATYLSVLTEGNADALYGDAIDALIRIQRHSRPGVLPDYDEPLLRRELDLFPDWFVDRHLRALLAPEEREALEEGFRRIVRNTLAQPQVYVHRDYHSRNLMVSEPNPGILDFQDAVFGPITYDLVSLFKDAYIEWEEARVREWTVRYWERARSAGLPVQADFGEFYRDFEWMGVQRHIKVLGIFARLYHRDGKSGYLKDMPLVRRGVLSACRRYPELSFMVRLLERLEASAARDGRQAVGGSAP
ncbi:MAG: phosphotransferase [Betaproteobacteria bacterium]|nr:phosphotransferase [Betaproteobacteria bacterium]